MQAAFDVKLKGRLGHDEADCKEVRVPNGIVRVVSNGLMYEPDPRHIELLFPIPRFPDGAGTMVTPGVKRYAKDEAEEEEEQPDTNNTNFLIASAHASNSSPRWQTRKHSMYGMAPHDVKQRLRFEPTHTDHEVPCDAESYPMPLDKCLFNGPIGSGTWMALDLRILSRHGVPLC